MTPDESGDLLQGVNGKSQEEVCAEMMPLSRQTNVRSLAVALNQKGKVTGCV